jgi:8-oxo-dGTP diphosphatase
MDGVRILLKATILKDGKLLALKRSDKSFSRPGAWDFPGGNLEFGEDVEECILREIKEETNLKVKNLQSLHIISEIDEKKNIFWVEICYLCDYGKGEIKLSDEHSEYKWLKKNEFLKLKSADYLKEFAKQL